ncbi:monoacylglycerol lipase abhd6-A-like [Melanotaenia boesemani]|uniref:monoacylglycerol lipase abhd6-A-like n=1 Tax=Melanotaenia boesemani TaxID=1250792 RepID=UPI001C03F58B|nr:monoacylglycerol lipase abhd6-A-like [Melanotaenia boesemani]XP_041837126.1 monoacylglycerol lipase abhd6-A-like [Melanotaenia boesemani]XP_041837127.1 monoacylglycerol lipase abhd6-A-like [Melanotaenia boesemani]
MELSLAKIMMLTGGILVLPVLAIVTSFLFWPGVLLKAYNWYWRRRLGLVVRYSHSGSYRFCYSSRGTPDGAMPSLLLLHGFSATKDMWLPVINYLPRDQHVVCVDMPGHEGTSRTSAEDYSIQGQVNRIHQFVQSIGLDKRPFHLVGTSMGGNVAGVYAACFPSDLSSLTLVCPAGLVYPTDSEFISRLRELENGRMQDESIPLIPRTPQELDDMLRLCCYNPPKLPRQVLRGLLANRIPNNGFYKEVFMEIVGEKSRHSLQEHLHLITAPLQVVWGNEDQVLDVSGAAVIQGVLPHCQVDLLESCGHSVALERPRKIAKLMVDFLSAQEVGDANSKKLS